MGVYIYCPRKSQGALELVRALDASRLRDFDGLDFWQRRRKVKLTKDDTIICWGAALGEIGNATVINGGDEHVGDKVQEARTLLTANVPTIKVSYAKPWAGAALPKNGVWLPRSKYHVGGNDLLNPPAHPDFWTLRETFVKEYRVHWFAGRSIRAGVKEIREGHEETANSWIRSFDAGWRINYDGFKSPAPLKAIARSAIKALGLTFGAVDIAERADKTLCVLEVNRAPGIEGNSIEAYAEAIRRISHHEAEGCDEGAGD